MVETFGFKCDTGIAALVNVDVTLADYCCATCAKMTQKPASCGSAKYKGDGNCDDDNNNKGCEFDGGDCCAKSVKGGKVKKDYCYQVG